MRRLIDTRMRRASIVIVNAAAAENGRVQRPSPYGRWPALCGGWCSSCGTRGAVVAVRRRSVSSTLPGSLLEMYADNCIRHVCVHGAYANKPHPIAVAARRRFSQIISVTSLIPCGYCLPRAATHSRASALMATNGFVATRLFCLVQQPATKQRKSTCRCACVCVCVQHVCCRARN